MIRKGIVRRRLIKGPHGSYVVTLPKTLCEFFQWKHGDEIVVEAVIENKELKFIVSRPKR